MRPNSRHCRTDRAGVTLVEILISLAILTLVTAAASSGTNYLTRRLIRARNAAVARNLVWKRLAEVKSGAIESGRNTGSFGSDFPGYSFAEEIAPARIRSQLVKGLYSYELTVIWPEAWQQESVVFSTLIADYIYEKEDAAGEVAEKVAEND